jgi:hypothetical protein
MSAKVHWQLLLPLLPLPLLLLLTSIGAESGTIGAAGTLCCVPNKFAYPRRFSSATFCFLEAVRNVLVASEGGPRGLRAEASQPRDDNCDMFAESYRTRYRNARYGNFRRG